MREPAEGKPFQLNIRLDAYTAGKLKALAAVSGQSLNSLISEAVKEYTFIRLTAVVEGQRIVNRFADFAPIMQARTTKEDQAALHAAQRQAMKNLPPLAEPVQTVQAPTSMGSTEGQEVENGKKEEAPSQTAEPVESAAPVEDASQSMPGNESEGQEAPSHMPDNQEASQTGNAVQNQEQAPNTVQTAEPVKASPAEQKTVKDMSQEELQAFVEDKRNQGVKDYDIAQDLRNRGLTCKHIGALIGKSQSSISRNTTDPEHQ